MFHILALGFFALSCPMPFLWHTHNVSHGKAVGAGPLRPVPSRDAGIAERGVGSLRQSCGKMPVHLSAWFLFVLEHAGISLGYEGISLEYAGIALEHEGKLGNLSGIHGNIRKYPGIASQASGFRHGLRLGNLALNTFDAHPAQQVEPLFRTVAVAIDHPSDAGLYDELRAFDTG